jgi:hypothetical protein
MGKVTTRTEQPSRQGTGSLEATKWGMVRGMETVEPPVTSPPHETPSPPPAGTGRPSLKERLKTLMANYGRLAIWVYFTLFFGCWIAVSLAIYLGFHVEGAGGNTGAIVGGYLVSKVTQPVRVLATLGLTPALERVLRPFPKVYQFLMGRPA